jgi:hypothetical protein
MKPMPIMTARILMHVLRELGASGKIKLIDRQLDDALDARTMTMPSEKVLPVSA